MSLAVVSDPNSTPQLAWTQDETNVNNQFNNLSKKYDFVQMTSHIGKLYTIMENIFHHEYEFEIITSK